MDRRVEEIIEKSSSVVFFGGAGVSTESNIPDFRSESGLYYAKEKYGYAPEEILSHTFFMNKTQAFFEYYRSNMIYPLARPNPAHHALATLEARGKLRAVVTQNIDGLHSLAGSKVVHELHGSVHRNTCMTCGTAYNLDYVIHYPETIPLCEGCGGIVKPDVVLYEESLKDEVVQSAILAIANADTLIVGGTSLVVYPAAGLLHYFKGDELILINKTPTEFDHRGTLVLYESIGKVLGYQE